MSLAKQVASQVANPVARQVVKSAGGGDWPWMPTSLANLRQYALDGGNAYESSTLNGVEYLRSLESYGDYRAPRQGRIYVADGIDDYIAVASLTGSETVASSGGTGTPTISAGRIDLTAGTYWDIVLSNGSHYPCNEESGSTSYDISSNAAHGTITNATLASFHGTSTSRTANRNNSVGYRLSSGVYIPKRLSDNLAADGNALTVTGQSPYPVRVDTPCVTGFPASQVQVALGDIGIPSSGDFSISVRIKFATEIQEIHFGDQSGFVLYNSGNLLLLYNYANSIAYTFTPEVTYSIDTWYELTLSRTSNTFTLNLSGSSGTATFSGSNVWTNFFLLSGGSNGQHASSSIADLRITTGGVTKYFPLQDGPGSSNTNRNIAWVASDGTGGVISNAIVNGTVANIWANRCPGYVKDHCIQYGGGIAANGAFVPGIPNSANDAAGNAKTLTAGKFGNPYSRINFNPFTAAELNGLGLETAYAESTARQSVSPTDTKFRRTAASGDDRFFATDAALSGADLTNAEGYVS